MRSLLIAPLLFIGEVNEHENGDLKWEVFTGPDGAAQSRPTLTSSLRFRWFALFLRRAVLTSYQPVPASTVSSDLSLFPDWNTDNLLLLQCLLLLQRQHRNTGGVGLTMNNDGMVVCPPVKEPKTQQAGTRASSYEEYVGQRIAF